jgi:hypothetical protein
MAPLRRQQKRASDGATPLTGGAQANDNDRSLESIEERLDREAGELLDVPAAVVCLVCGELDCTGCEDRDLSRSGIVAIVAWERPAMPALTRLWSTARSTTRDAESFFELLPDGPVMPALRFAAICELLAAFSIGSATSRSIRTRAASRCVFSSSECRRSRRCWCSRTRCMRCRSTSAQERAERDARVRGRCASACMRVAGTW